MLRIKSIKKIIVTVLCITISLITAFAVATLPATAATDSVFEFEVNDGSSNILYVKREMTWNEFTKLIYSTTSYTGVNCTSATMNASDYVKTGLKVNITSKTSAFIGTIILLGDIDKNGHVNYNDYQYYMEQIRLDYMNDFDRKIADVNRNGSVDVRDKFEFKNKIRASSTVSSSVSVFCTYGQRIFDLDPNTTMGTLQYSSGYTFMGSGGKLFDKSMNQITDTARLVTTGMYYRPANGINYRVIILGDVNCDGKITIEDTMETIKIMNGASREDYVRLAADCNMDGTIDINDVNEINFIISQQS